MKRFIGIFLILAILSGCSNSKKVKNDLSPQANTATTVETSSMSKDNSTSAVHVLTFTDYIDWLDEYAKQENFLGITDLSETKNDKNPEITTYSFNYEEGLVHLNVSTENGVVMHILSTISPYSLNNDSAFDSEADTQMAAYALALEPIAGINEEWDFAWHVDQFVSKAKKSNNSTTDCTYTADNWRFTVIIGEALLSITATNTENTINIGGWQSEQLEPETETTKSENTEPVQTVPYTTDLSASVAIYKEPDNDSTFVQNVGQDGIYTIVEETYDSMGNLWGKLKSGLGWVMLQGVGSSSQKICSQCGQTEPEAVFTEDWQQGDLCFGCSYDDFHGGEDGKLYCSACGADCTYRGLEEDGRCEDCSSGN